MEIRIQDLQKKTPLNLPQIKKIVKTILREEGIQACSLAVVFVSSQKIKSLNKKYLNRNYVTDVLAFDMKDTSVRAGVSGDIFISTDMAFKNAGVYNTSLQEELSLYLIHGILHLLGFDDRKSADVRRMRKKEAELMALLGKRVEKIIL